MKRRTNKWVMTEQLFQTVKARLELMEHEDKYMKALLSESDTSTSVSGLGMIGTQIPKLFGSADTFIVNPQGVGVGVLARMSETDPTVLSSIQLKSQMMLSKIGEYQHDDDEIEDFVRRFLARMEGPTWQEALEAQTSFVPFGFSVSEIAWGLNGESQKIPLRVRTYHPSTIVFEVDELGDITKNGIIQFTQQQTQFANPNRVRGYYDGFDRSPFETPHDWLMPYRMPFIQNYGLVRIPKAKVIHHVNNSMTSFGSPYGKAYVRTAHLAWQLKVFFMKHMGIAGKRNAQPFIWATAPMNNNKVEFIDPDTGERRQMTPIEALTKMLALREFDDAVVTGPPPGYNLQAIINQADLNSYLAVLGWLDTQIFRGFMLPSLIMTEGNAGSRSLGDKHFQIVDRIAETEAEKFTQTIIRQMIRPAIEMNFGHQDDYGRFAERPQSIDERDRLASMFSQLASAGFINSHNQIDGDYVRSTLHLPNQEASFYEQGMPNFGPMGGGPAGLPKEDDEKAPAAAPAAPAAEDAKNEPAGDEAGEGGKDEDAPE